MTLRSFALAFVLAFLAGAISAPVSADQSCPSKLFAREVVEGGFQGIVCDQYCRLHLSLGNGQSAEFIAAGAVQD
ncbi:MAG: hypothetical protein LBE49_00560, partial [Deltaproteobacteria bacterium]|nr:hypothetical protein [Deltaproteobacteria bacterium]